MEFFKAFPIAIIDEDYEGKQAAGRGMRQLAEAIEKEGFRVVAGVSYADAARLAEVFNNEACWLVSVDGAEAGENQWQLLEQILATKRRRNDRLPIFLFGDERTAEMVPASVLKHANAVHAACSRIHPNSSPASLLALPTTTSSACRRRCSRR